MKVLIVAPMLPQADGPGAMPMLLGTQLEALGTRHEVSLVVGVGDEPWEADAARAAAGAATHVRLVDRRRPAGARQRMRRRARLSSEWAFTRRPWRTVWFAAAGVQEAIDELARRQTFDVVAVEDNAMAMFRLPPGVPAVLTEHEVERSRPAHWSERRDPLARWILKELDWRRWEGFQTAAWRRYDRLQVFTDYDAQAVTERAPDLAPRVRVNPFGLHLPRPADPAREEPGSLLFVGNFTHRPNRDAAAWLVREIMPRVREAHPGARLRLVGSDPPREVLEMASDAVQVLPDVPSVDPYVEAAAVCVAPIRLGGGMRLKVLLAMGTGKAVVSTTRGAEGYLRADGEPPIAIGDEPGAIAATIVRLLGDEPARRELGQRARRFAEEFHSPAAWGQRLEQVYEEACRARRSGS